jgi:ABC-type Zn uptake system ZnuABC Zn-binding protein ZnuA
MRLKMKTLCFAMVVALAAAGLLSGCGGGSTTAKQSGTATAAPDFMATIHPLTAIVREVAGDKATVGRLLPPNASPHVYEPKPSDAFKTAKTKVLFYASLDLDSWALDLESPRKVPLINFVPEADLLPMGEHHHHHDHGHDHGHDGHDHGHGPEHGDGELDPHFWVDPALVRKILPNIAEVLAEEDPKNADAYRANAERFAKDLEKLEKEIAEILAPVQGEAILTLHPGMRYFFKRFGLVDGGSIEEIPGTGISTKALQRILREVKEDKIRAVFIEPQLDRKNVDIIAEAAHIPVGMVNVEGGLSDEQTYADLLRWNAQSIRDTIQQARAATPTPAVNYPVEDDATARAAIFGAHQAAGEPDVADINAALEAELAAMEAEEAGASDATPAAGQETPAP